MHSNNKSSNHTDSGKKKTSASAVRRNNKRKRIKKLMLAVIIVEVIAVCYLSMILFVSKQSQPEQTKSLISSIADSTELMQQAKKMKADYKELAYSIKSQDFLSAMEKRIETQQDIEEIRATLESPFWKTASAVPRVKHELDTINELLQLLENADRTMIGPGLDLMVNYPASELKTDKGFRTDIILMYLDYAERTIPLSESMIQQVKTLDLSTLDKEGKIQSYMSKGEELLAYGKELSAKYFPLIRTILGNGSDRYYLFAAQNSSELRGSGGFPGAMAIIEIKDGVLSLSDFIEVREIFNHNWATPAEAKVTETETTIFYNRMATIWDVDFCPNYERVASIWALDYEILHGIKVDGIFSATQVVIQKMLSFLGDVTLSDGTVLNGENATRILGHDLYFKYLASFDEKDYEKEEYFEVNSIVDGLFSECAEKTFKLLTSSIDISHVNDYISFFEDSTADRSIMMWMADEKEQELIRQAGWNAGLNNDPKRPEIGIFYNSMSASKITWFLDIDAELSEPFTNKDGSKSYELTVTLSNMISDEEKAAAGEYILGTRAGIYGAFYIFAPAGGTIGEFETVGGWEMRESEYEGLALGYYPMTLMAGTPFIVHCVVTTSPEAEEPIRLVLPPTMTKYRTE